MLNIPIPELSIFLAAHGERCMNVYSGMTDATAKTNARMCVSVQLQRVNM